MEPVTLDTTIALPPSEHGAAAWASESVTSCSTSRNSGHQDSVSGSQHDKDWHKHRKVKFKVYIEIERAKDFWYPSAGVCVCVCGYTGHSCVSVTNTAGRNSLRKSRGILAHTFIMAEKARQSSWLQKHLVEAPHTPKSQLVEHTSWKQVSVALPQPVSRDLLLLNKAYFQKFPQPQKS